MLLVIYMKVQTIIVPNYPALTALNASATASIPASEASIYQQPDSAPDSAPVFESGQESLRGPESEEEDENEISFKVETAGSQPPSPPDSSMTPVQLSQTNFINRFRVKTEDEKGQLTENKYLSKLPIDFIFRGTDNEGKLKVCVLDNRGLEAKRYNKSTPFIFYAKEQIFSRADH